MDRSFAPNSWAFCAGLLDTTPHTGCYPPRKGWPAKPVRNIQYEQSESFARVEQTVQAAVIHSGSSGAIPQKGVWESGKSNRADAGSRGPRCKGL